MQMEDFYTSDKAEEGAKLPLYKPNGEKTEHWFLVLGIDSPTFKKAEAQSKRKGAKIALIEDADERDEKGVELERELVASLIKDWSFGTECTMEEKIKFLKKAPQIESAVNRFSAQRTLFFAKESTASTNGSK
ncbi:tail assembly chaperone [Alteromonas phage vB_AcoS-R7M]|uniref:Tail assembly chaperone n=1 Tax=Alteromonas phage vB_AcoS-R7M TaxID=2729541 RepID=A0A6M3YTG2_9CAUD|nr:Tail assembly chaperone [Alteromonas phage vB_AcoS-R7M]QJI53356.1 tail assembly chaperone [Alteromonas phage vB_AcoS-R7M]